MFRNPRSSESRTEPRPDRADDELQSLNQAIEQRDTQIAALEHTLEEERTRSEALHDALAQSKFQLEILEKSYSTQLASARERAAAAEQSVADQQARIADLEARHEQLTEELAQARRSPRSLAADSFVMDALSVDDLLAASTVPPEETLELETETAADAADAAADPEIEEMLAPEIMFAAKAKR